MSAVDMDLGDTRLILSACMEQGLLRNQTAYVLATAYWETARTMEPVEEAFWLSEGWRKENLRYYPWHGRGYVQLTWERNYHKAKAETGVDIVTDPSAAMRPDVAAQTLVVGCRDGWFTGKRLDDYITLKSSNFRGARRVVNGTDKAAAIAEIAREYDATLKEMNYGVEPDIPIANDRLDGTAPRKNPAQSTTNISVFGAGLTMLSTQIEAIKAAVAPIAESVGLTAEQGLLVAGVGFLVWIGRERLRKWAEGDR